MCHAGPFFNRGGCWLAATYASLVIVVFAVTAATTKPSNVGLDWIPLVMLAWPWPARLLLPGVIVNTAVWYLLGSVVQHFWSTSRH